MYKFCQKIKELIKANIGVEDFSEHYSKSITKRSENKDERKRKLLQMVLKIR
jgi:hypothetical protein